AHNQKINFGYPLLIFCLISFYSQFLFNDKRFIRKKFLFTVKEREKLLEDMENKITYLQSVISTLKDDSLLADEKLKALQEEVRLLWDASRKNNFELHVLESEAQDTEDRVEAVNLKVEKV
ncbi:hypothetical protein ES288_A01G145600v1, partial [Gossypium darwinii]